MGSSPNRCRWWRLHENGGGISSTVPFLFISFLLISSIGVFCIFYLFNNPNVNNNDSSVGCQEDNDGSWGIGVFYGDSPFALKPIEDVNIWENKSAAWPVANPVLTCASVVESGFPSNYVSDPFLYAQGDDLYVFFVTKNPTTNQGDIAAARSTDDGVSWEPLGVALDEPWHLSFPYVFDYDGHVYLMPDGTENGDLRVYRAVDFPLKWSLEKIVFERPLTDAFVMNHGEKYWLFGSENGVLEIWHGGTPFGPWAPHKKNLKTGARNGGPPFVHHGNVYRLAHDDTRVRAFKIEVLTTEDFKESEVDLGFENPRKGRNSWNGARSNHLGVHRLGSGKWVGVADGDRVPFGDVSRRRALGCAAVLAAGALVFVVGLVLGFVPPAWWCRRGVNKRTDALFLRPWLSRVNRAGSFLRCKVNPNTFSGKLVLTLVLTLSVVLTCVGVGYVVGGNGAQKPYAANGRFSQFTMIAMTYDARMWNLRMYVKHYSQCASVREIVVVWNKGAPPDPAGFDSAVPVRVRVEDRNSLNNRFNPDPSITTRAVLELDDDIMMSCDDIERGFKTWRDHPDRLVGFYPRLVSGPPPLRYRPERHARRHNGYNMVLTGAVFLDGRAAFGRYWSYEAAAGRQAVDEAFNCEDVLMNFLYANATPPSAGPAVEYVRPVWAVDTSKFSGVAISGNTQAHYAVRSKCLERFTALYGGLSDRKVAFKRRKDGWDE